MQQTKSDVVEDTSFPIEKIRQAFPALSASNSIYLDNPAGTQVPAHVVRAVSDCLVNSNANLGGYFRTSIAAGEIVETGHQAMADLLGTNDPGEVIIGANMTTLTFHLSRSICRDFAPGDEIIVTRMDHEGDVAPWLEIAEDKGLVVVWADFDTERWQVTEDTLRSLLTERTKLVALNHSSNLTGAVNDIKRLVSLVKDHGAITYVDSTQFVPHGLVDVREIGCDFLVCSAYKFFGPHLGIAWGRRAALEAMHAYKCRCVSEELPAKFETGTPQIELIAGLCGLIEYYEWLGAELGAAGTVREKIQKAYEASERYEDGLARRLIGELQALPGVRIYGPVYGKGATPRVPTVSFRHRDTSPETIARALAKEGIFVWDGHNYALGTVRQLGIPEREGVVRVGLAHYNTETEVGKVVEAIASAL